MIKRGYITKVSINGIDMTDHVTAINGTPVIAPVKLPRDARAVMPQSMERHELGFISPDSIYVDASERMWVNAECFVSRIEHGPYVVRIGRTECGVNMDMPRGYVYTTARRCPFAATLPVQNIEIVED